MALVILSLVATTLATSQSSSEFPIPAGYKLTKYSASSLEPLWAKIASPIAPPKYTSTVVPTPEPAAYPQPNEFHPLVASHDTNLTNLKLPKNFMWGVASSAYQIEGAAKLEGKGPSIWDALSHNVPNFVADNSTGDNVAEQYMMYKVDIARMKGLGVPAFSPSFAWPRFFPTGKAKDGVNEEAVKHYDDVINELTKSGIKPVITLFHWDTPLALFQEYGAWLSPKAVDDYVDYAKFVIQRYDSAVSTWYTFNEPQYCNWQFSEYPLDGKYYPIGGQDLSKFAGKEGKIRARFLCGHYTLLAHARVAKWYHNEFKGKGRITFKNSGNFQEPRTQSPADIRAAQRDSDFSIGWFGGPWTDGDYPKSLRETLGDLLPTFTSEEKSLIKGSCDFYAIDPYTSFTLYSPPDAEKCYTDRNHGGYPECVSSTQSVANGFPMGPSSDNGVSWLKSTPQGIRKFLKKIMVLYPSVPDIVVSEIGFAEPFESKLTKMEDILWDLRRADYYQHYLDAILQSIHYDHINVTGAWGWSIYDNFEWLVGSDVRFGMQYLNYTSLERTPKASMFQFLNWFKQHSA
ncbi:putative permease [Venturia nashicola]|uniref:Putative permease n=1 Tax=Venturia nashicola TaxID=86259 RepID=A0A4Z1PK09_9PEZI|nr:putative permease [Venturia nashicola]TLD35496.1 putative permease [Venturia nashicola]